ncbi:MAG: chromate reductase [Phycisphaerales bacterium]|jgi:chromate reductase
MTTSPKLLAFSGSLRKDSFNQRLVHAAADLARAAGAQVTVVSLNDFDLPVFSEDLEAEGTPEGVTRLKAAMKSHHGFIIACPEYNSSITAALKNAIDWATRPAQGEASLECFSGKVVGLCAASPGALGGVRGLDHVREILSNIMCHVVPPGVAVGGIHEQFNEDGSLKESRSSMMLTLMCENAVQLCRGIS